MRGARQGSRWNFSLKDTTRGERRVAKKHNRKRMRRRK